MLIERIGETRLLILLAREDMQLYNISYDDLDWRDDHSREAIRRILEQANDETGFCTRDRRLLIEAIPGKTGCMLVITLLPRRRNGKRFRIKRGPAIAAHRRSASRPPILLRLEETESLLRAMHILAGIPFVQGELYSLHQVNSASSCYYLLLEGALPSREKALLQEYGRFCGRSALKAAYIRERGTLLARGQRLNAACRLF
ncbi:MAG TPA: adaptor protein MecA [Candidatus Gallacutalibacter stercoravium]|nr:adaptor protein MecA [Candidatus Gallacutalibacter stercoravium]